VARSFRPLAVSIKHTKFIGEIWNRLTCFVRGKGVGAELRNLNDESGNTKGGSINVPLTSCLAGLESAV